MAITSSALGLDLIGQNDDILACPSLRERRSKQWDEKRWLTHTRDWLFLIRVHLPERARGVDTEGEERERKA
jgi:hypothetical protein